MKVSLILLLCISFVSFVHGVEFLTLRNTSGSIIEAQILNYQSGKVQLKRKDGVTFVVSISIFDEASKALIESASSAGKEEKTSERSSSPKSRIPFKKLNEVIGQSLFEDE